jgi:hypothetical protein
MKAGLGHALERALQRAEGDLLLWRRIATILSNDLTMAGRVLPNARLVRIVAPTGQLVVDQGVVVSFYIAASNPRPGEVTVGLKEVAYLVDRILEREAQEALPAHKPQVVRKERTVKAKPIVLGEVCEFVGQFQDGIDTTTVGIQFGAWEGRASLSLSRIINMGVQYKKLALNNGWLMLPKKEGDE